MCFSPESSFTAAAVLGVTGVVALRAAGRARALPLALVPLLFAAHQFVEGFTWLEFDSGSARVLEGGPTIWIYTLIAFVLWPVYIPFAVGMLEPDRRRRRVIAACGVLGVTASGYFLVSLLSQTPTAHVLEHGIAYYTHGPWLTEATVPYIFAAIVPCLVSSIVRLRVVGVIWAISAVLAMVLVNANAFASTWCFFAAAISLTIITVVSASRDQTDSVQALPAHV